MARRSARCSAVIVQRCHAPRAAARAARRTARTSSSSHCWRWMSNSSVRDAFVASVACTLPPVSFQSSHVSIVPASSSPRSARTRAPSTLSRIHAIFVAEKYGSSNSPVRATSATAVAFFASAGTFGRAPVLPHDGPMDRASGVAVPHDDRLALHGDADRHVARRRACHGSALRAHAIVASKISSASCSTHPSRGKCCANGAAPARRRAPSSPKSMARVLVVPASRARTGTGDPGRRVAGLRSVVAIPHILSSATFSMPYSTTSYTETNSARRLRYLTTSTFSGSPPQGARREQQESVRGTGPHQ